MKVEEMKARLAQVEKAMTEMQANYNMLAGNRNELLFWIQNENEVISEATPEATAECCVTAD